VLILSVIAPDTLPGACVKHMRRGLTVSTSPSFHGANFAALRDLYVTRLL